MLRNLHVFSASLCPIRSPGETLRFNSARKISTPFVDRTGEISMDQWKTYGERRIAARWLSQRELKLSRVGQRDNGETALERGSINGASEPSGKRNVKQTGQPHGSGILWTQGWPDL